MKIYEQISKMLFLSGLTTLITFLLIAGYNTQFTTEWINSNIFFKNGLFWSTVERLSLDVPIIISIACIVISFIVLKFEK